MDSSTATLIAAGLAAAVAFVGYVGVVYYRLGRLERGLEADSELTLSESKRLSDKMDALRTETKSDYARLSDKMDANYTQLSDKMDANYAQLSDKMDALRTETKLDYARLSDRMDTDYARLSDKMDYQHAETMAAIQRLADLFIGHSHEPDGTIIFRIPPGSGA